VLAAIPLTPGGLGVVEATLTLTLVGFNTTRAIATLGVVGYRLVNFWLPIPVGGLAYLSLQVDSGLAAHGGRIGWLKWRWAGLRALWERGTQGRPTAPGTPEDHASDAPAVVPPAPTASRQG
jgi:hypothetical protein